MADKSGIEWTDATWNPTTGCDRVSPGCANCYALTLAPRLQAMAQKHGPTDPYMRDGDPKTSGPGFGLMMHPGRLEQPIRWKRPRRIFVNSMSDLFHPEVTDDFLDEVFAVMALAHQHTFQVLTKRPERMRAYLATPTVHVSGEDVSARQTHVLAAAQRVVNRLRLKGAEVTLKWPLPNVWLGTSVENARWRTRIDELRETPAAVRFLSCEPLLGPLICPTCGGAGWDVEVKTEMACCGNTGGGECRSYCVVQEQVPYTVECRTRGAFGEPGNHDLNLKGIDWVIIGGESGPGAREMQLEWVRAIVGACNHENSETLPFVKQLGDVWSRANLGHPGHGGDIETFPPDLQVREYPA